MNLKEIRALSEVLRQYELTEIEVEREGLRIRLRRDTAGGPSAAAPTVAAAPGAGPAARPTEPAAEEALGRVTAIESPMVGTFYRAPSPEAAPYVREGDVVKKGQVVGIVEAMKLMNEIESKVAGRIVKVLVENAQPVEYGPPLFLVEP
jgi:acetyl-CoA carboxylase biotin carboxyl carrier protein